MKSLILKQNSYGLRVFCSKCNNKLNHDKLYTCKHPSHQRYKQYVYHDGKARVQTYDTKDFDGALKSAIDFKKKVKNGTNSSRIESKVLPDTLSVMESAERYVQYKNGVDVFDFEKKELDKDYLSSIRLYVQQFIDVLRDNGFNVDSMLISNLKRKHVDLWWNYIISRYDSEWSRHAALRAMRVWINHVINYQEVLMRNPFKDVKATTPEAKIITITGHEFSEVCNVIKKADPWAYLNGETTERKNRYRNYLINAFKLGLYTGLRREELVGLRWNDIYFESSTQGNIITTENLKVQRITGKSYKPKYIPVFEQLKDFLIEIEWERYKDSDEYILEPGRTIQEQTMMDAISKGFSFYYSKAFPNQEKKQFKCLRKTYLSYLEKFVGDDIIHLSSHGGKEVLEKHYVNPAIVARGYGMKIF